MHIVSFFPNLSANTPPRTVPGIVPAINSDAEIELPFLLLENCAYEGVVNDCVIMEAIIRTNAHYG